jgi:tight adherence protein C
VTGAPLLAGAAGVCAAAGLLDLAGTRRRGSRWDAGRLIRGLLRRAARSPAPRDVAARVDAAGVGASATEVMAAKLVGAPAAALAALALAPAAPGRLPIALLLAAPAAGFWLPDLWLRARARRRAGEIEREQPEVLDLLRVAIGAGLSPWRALAEVGRRHPGTLAGELGAAARRVALGVPAGEALATLERRCPAAGAHALVAVLARADRLGAPPGRAFAALAEEARARRARTTAERAARAGPKIQLVVALLLVPSVLLLVAAALIPALTGARL